MKDKKKEEEAKELVEKFSEGDIKVEIPKSSECKIKDDMKDKKKEEEAKELVEKFSEGDIKVEIPKSSEAVSSENIDSTVSFSEGEMKVEGKEEKKEEEKDSSENIEESGKIDEVVSTNSANQVHSCNTINHNMEEQNKLNGKINKEDQLIDQISTNEVQENRNLHIETKEVSFSKW